MRLDELPFFLRPLVAIYGWGLALPVRVLMLLLRMSCRIRFYGAPPEGPAIFAFWHDRLLLYFMIFHRPRGRQVWMNHAAWYMKPVHITLQHFMGVERLALGSTGDGGRAALEEVVGALREGASTCITPDGPAGPAYEVKPGVLVMARQSRVPLVGIRFSVSRSMRLPTWDRKILALPFCSIDVYFSEPLSLRSGESRALQLGALTEALGPASIDVIAK